MDWPASKAKEISAYDIGGSHDEGEGNKISAFSFPFFFLLHQVFLKTGVMVMDHQETEAMVEVVATTRLVAMGRVDS